MGVHERVTSVTEADIADLPVSQGRPDNSRSALPAATGPTPGQKARLKFTGAEGIEYQASFVIDDSALDVS